VSSGDPGLYFIPIRDFQIWEFQKVFNIPPGKNGQVFKPSQNIVNYGIAVQRSNQLSYTGQLSSCTRKFILNLPRVVPAHLQLLYNSARFQGEFYGPFLLKKIFRKYHCKILKIFFRRKICVGQSHFTNFSFRGKFSWAEMGHYFQLFVSLWLNQRICARDSLSLHSYYLKRRRVLPLLFFHTPTLCI
jgi:hypothetical protein